MQTFNSLEWISLLEEELSTHKKLLEISKQKTEFLVEGNVEAVEKINQTENRYVLLLGNSRDKREELTEKTAQILSIDASELNLTSLKKYMKLEEAITIDGIQQEFINVVTELKASNDTNIQLLTHGLQFVEFSMQLLTGASSAADNRYSKHGELNESTMPRSMFDTKR